MKKVFLLLVVTAITFSVQAGMGEFASAIRLQVNGVTQYYTTTGDATNRFGPTPFSGSLGTVVGQNNQLNLRGAALKTFKDANGNVCGGFLNYTIYTAGNRPVTPVFSQIALSFNCNCTANVFPCAANSPCGNNDQVWENTTANTDLTTGLAVGTYTLEIYYTITGSTTSSSACDNNAVVVPATAPTTVNGFAANFTVSGILPLKISSFTATALNKEVKLFWSVEDNEEALSFEIQKSDRGVFKNIQLIDAQNISGIANYTFTDYAAPVGIVLYRLKITSRSGAFHYSPDRLVRGGNSRELTIVLLGNPVKDFILFTPIDAASNKAQVQIINGSGILVAKYSMAMQNGVPLRLPVSQLASGIYRLQIGDGFTVHSVSFVKN